MKTPVYIHTQELYGSLKLPGQMIARSGLHGLCLLFFSDENVPSGSMSANGLMWGEAVCSHLAVFYR